MSKFCHLIMDLFAIFLMSYVSSVVKTSVTVGLGEVMLPTPTPGALYTLLACYSCLLVIIG